MNLFRAIINILHTDATNRHHHGVNHYPEHWIGSAKMQDRKLGELMLRVNQAQAEMDTYVLSRMERR